MTTSADFWDKVSEKYSKKSVPSESIYQEKLQRTQKLFTEDAKVLEIGCGTGTTALIHSPFVKSIVAYDYSPQMIRIAQERKKKKKVNNVDFLVKAVEDINYEKETYDVVMAHSILHLTENNDKIISDIFHSLKKGGYFVSSSGCLKEMNVLIRLILPLMKALGKAPSVNVFTAAELIETHKRDGFQNFDAWHYKKGELFLIAEK